MTLEDKIAAIDPPQNNLRMLFQQSAFTIHGSPKPLEDYVGIDKCLLKFVIPSKLKAGILTILNTIGINESTIFPELEHLANYINKEHNL